jgi:hypothetical protein
MAQAAATTTLAHWPKVRGTKAKKYARGGISITPQKCKIATKAQTTKANSPRDATTAFPTPTKIKVAKSMVRATSTP